MVQRYKLSKSKPKPENYEAVLPRIISSPRSREVAASYIQNANFEDKMAITKMLNEWNKDTLSIEESTSVIRPEAVPVIKNWLNNADSNDVTCAKNLLSYISDEKKRVDAMGQRSNSIPSSRQSSRPSSKQSVRSKSSSRMITSSGGRPQNAPQRPVLRPKTSITYGSFYPSKLDGFGNNTSHFNIVKSLNRPKTMVSKAELYRQKYINNNENGLKAPAPLNPINRSSIFGNVVYPVPQDTIHLDGSVTQRSDDGHKSLSPRSVRPSTQGAIPNESALRKQWSEEKVKFSANLQNFNDNETKESFVYPCGDETHRDLGLRKHWPGRQYNQTNFLLR